MRKTLGFRTYEVPMQNQMETQVLNRYARQN